MGEQRGNKTGLFGPSPGGWVLPELLPFRRLAGVLPGAGIQIVFRSGDLPKIGWQAVRRGSNVAPASGAKFRLLIGCSRRPWGGRRR